MTTLNEDIITRFITGQCSEEELQVISRWMKEYPEQKDDLFGMERMYLHMQAENMSQIKVEKALQRVRGRISQEEQSLNRPLGLLSFRRYAAAAVVVLVAGLTLFWLGRQFRLQSEELIMVQASDSVARKVVLPDGSVVWLNKRSSLSYPAAFAASQRKVNLVGEAFFEVSKDKDHPFVVESKAMSVKVLGTKFNFSNDSVAHCSEVTLVEGAVEVSSNQSAGQLVLSPGQKARLDYQTGHMTVHEVENKNYGTWRYEVIGFEQATIRTIAKKLEAIYGVRIHVAGQLPERTTYSGRLLRKDNIEEVFEALTYTLPISYKKRGQDDYQWQ